MPRLPTFENYQVQAAASRLRFLDNFAENASELIGSSAPEADRGLSAEAALTEAAALAFATDRTSEGKGAISRILSRSEVGRPSPLRQVTMATILGKGRTRLQPEGVVLDGVSDAALRVWCAPAPVVAASAGTLLAAALASGSPLENLQLLSRPALLPDSGRLAQLTVATCAEAAILPLFGASLDDDGLLRGGEVSTREEDFAFGSFVAMHNRFASAIRLNRSDGSRWIQLRCRAPLIDWPLLMLHLALLRRASRRYTFDDETDELGARLAIFLRDLAVEIDDGTSDGSRGAPGGNSGPRGYDQQVQHAYGVQAQG